jgi:hypothetical protein
MTTPKELIESHKSKIVEKWLGKSLEVYSSDAGRFYSKKKNPFGNPVGTALSKGIEAFVDGLIRGDDPKTLGAHLEEIVQIRSVQQLEPSAALKFLPFLKDILKEVLGGKTQDSSRLEALDELSCMVDEVMLRVFDLYLKYRERVFEIRVNDVKRKVSHLLKRTSFFNNDDDTGSNEESMEWNTEPGIDETPGR